MRTELATGFGSRADLKEALPASTWLPLVLKGTATFRGRRAVDGAILTPHPFGLALSDGCMHVLSLSTKPMRPPAARPNGAQLLAARHLDRLRPRLGREYLAALDRYRGAARLAATLDVHSGRSAARTRPRAAADLPQDHHLELDPRPPTG